MEDYKQKYIQLAKFIKDLYPHMSDCCKEKSEEMIPELKESEDERIRKELIEKVKETPACIGFNNKNAVLAWLEKQGEQKPTVKIEPKFKVGDWINKDGAIWRIEGVSGKEYILGGRPDVIIQEPIHIIDSEFRLWTIQDAKDGDILATKDGNICIFNGNIAEYSYPSAHCGLTQYGFKVYDETLPFTSHSMYPATKEQRNLLFEKMKEAWDIKEKKVRRDRK